MDSITIVFMLAGILIVGALLLGIMGLSKKGRQRLDVDKYRIKYLSIEQQLKKDEQSSYHLVVLNADKLLDQALIERGFKGKTMGERMKRAGTTFTNNNGVWAAHKLRNRIAHESDIKISYDETRYALAYIKKALKDLGAI